MSWIFGFFGNTPQLFPTIPRVYGKPLVEFKSDKLSLVAGGIPETCMHGSFSFSRDCDFNHWLVAGLGIKTEANGCRFLSNQNWQEILVSPKPDITSLDGHFVALRWNEKQFECYTDQFGLRTFFLVKTPLGIAFSTRSDWLARFSGCEEIDFEQFGSHWLTFNQFSHESLIKGLTRLGPNSHAKCTPDSLVVTSTPWLPDGRQRFQQEAIELIESLSNPQLPSNKRFALGLSGGLDSRVLLAVMQSQRRQPFSLFLFGHPNEPDVQVARQIAAAEKIKQQFYSELLPFPNNLTDHLRAYVPETQLVSPVSLWLKLRFYSTLYENNTVIIDGGFGEIARRQFMNRALKRAKSLLLNGQTAQLLPYISTPRASIFNHEVEQTMKKGVADQLGNVWKEMPSMKDIGLENFVDLLVVRYRFTNYAGAGQASMDREIVSYMPFIQPSYVNAAFALPIHIKRNGRFYRQIIRTRRPALVNVPLVKGTSTYPFWMTTVPAWMFTTLKTKFGNEFVDPLPVLLLQHLKEFVLDTVQSDSVRSFAAYDYAAVKSRVDQFYGGETKVAREVDWWLSFELWRQAHTGQKT